MAKSATEDSKLQHHNRVLSDENEALKLRTENLRQELYQQTEAVNQLSQQLEETKDALRVETIKFADLSVKKTRAEKRAEDLESFMRGICASVTQAFDNHAGPSVVVIDDDERKPDTTDVPPERKRRRLHPKD